MARSQHRRARTETAQDRPAQSGTEAIATGTAAGGLMLGALNVDKAGATEPERPDNAGLTAHMEAGDPAAEAGGRSLDTAETAFMSDGAGGAAMSGISGHGGALAHGGEAAGARAAPPQPSAAAPDGPTANPATTTAQNAAATAAPSAQSDPAPTGFDTFTETLPAQLEDSLAEFTAITPATFLDVHLPDLDGAVQDIAATLAAVPVAVGGLLDDGVLIQTPFDGPSAMRDLPETLLGAEHDARTADFLSDTFYADGMSGDGFRASGSSFSDVVSGEAMDRIALEPAAIAFVGQSIIGGNDAPYDATSLEVGGVFGSG